MKNVTLSSRRIREGISKLESLSLAKVDEKYIGSIISEMIRGYRISTPSFDEPLTVYRARKCNKPKYISELSYPPNKEAIDRGRGNFAGQSVFYCSTHSYVPIYELECSAGDKIALSTWRTRSQLILNHIGFTEEVKDIIRSNRNLNEIYDFVTKTNNFSELNEMVHEYLGYLFSRPIKGKSEFLEYKLTSALANIMLHSNEINGLIYPTIQMWGNADNILLKPEYVSEGLEFVNVEYIEINELINKEYSVNRIDSATAKTSVDGLLSWSGRPLQLVLNKNGMAATFEYKGDGTWLGKDQDNNIIDPI